MSSDTIKQNLPASIIAIGAGNRMRTYAYYLQQHPDEGRIVAVVEPNKYRRDTMADLFGIPQSCRYENYKRFFEDPVPGDAVFICTPDKDHFQCCFSAIQKGYNVLLEKPIAQTFEECMILDKAARKANVIVSICHVMHYYPCFLKLKELVQNGNLGEIISINHTEWVGLDRMTHSYVRGTFGKKENSNPMFLAKCCHDVDFLLWLMGDVSIRKVSSFGSLRWFRKENAPQGAAKRCLDCSIEGKCPFSAVNLYLRKREWIRNIDVLEGESIEDSIQRELREGDIGRCVYYCDNDVVDHQSVTVDTENGVTITMMMECFTRRDSRKTYIYMTEGEIECNEKTIKVTRFIDNSQKVYNFLHTLKQPYHAGADLKIVEEFLYAIKNKRNHLSSLLHNSILSHLVCYAAEDSRLQEKVIDIGALSKSLQGK